MGKEPVLPAFLACISLSIAEFSICCNPGLTLDNFERSPICRARIPIGIALGFAFLV